MKTDPRRVGEWVATLEKMVGLAVTVYLIWAILPDTRKQAIRAHIGLPFAEWRRYRRVQYERRLLESESWHVGQIVRDYDRTHDPDWFRARLLPSDRPPTVPGMGETENG